MKKSRFTGEQIVFALISGYQTVPSVWDVATRYLPAAWTTVRASDALSLPGSPARRSVPAQDAWRTGITRHGPPTVFSPFCRCGHGRRRYARRRDHRSACSGP